MQTLIEYVLAQYLGPPRRVKGNGESYWYCPNCRSHNFHSLPLHPVHKQYASCPKKSCGIFEDVIGVVKHFHSGRYARWPKRDYGECLLILERMEETFKVTQPQPQQPVQRRGTRSKSNVKK